MNIDEFISTAPREMQVVLSVGDVLQLKDIAWCEGRDAAAAALKEWREIPFDIRRPGDIIPALKSPYKEEK